jgi:hypothetical protein
MAIRKNLLRRKASWCQCDGDFSSVTIDLGCRAGDACGYAEQLGGAGGMSHQANSLIQVDDLWNRFMNGAGE